jgi:hypothetical protein
MAVAIVDFSTVREEIFGYPRELAQDIKEFALVDVESLSSQQWRFMNRNLGRTEHAEYYSLSTSLDEIIRDYSGDIPYSMLLGILEKATDSYKVLFTHDEEKCRTLKSLLKRCTVFNLKDFIDIELSEIPAQEGTQCLYHFQANKSHSCPHSRAYQLVKACEKNWVHLNMFDSHNRLKTFSNWNNSKVSKEQLASCGFIHKKDQENKEACECIFCGITITNWCDESNPYTRHRNQATYCPIFNFNNKILSRYNNIII